MYVFGGGSVLVWENTGTCRNTLMNGHWEELIGKVEEFLHATDNPDNYRMRIQQIIRSSSDGRWQLETFLGCTERDSLGVVVWYEWLCIDPCRHPTTTGRLDIRVDGLSFNC